MSPRPGGVTRLQCPQCQQAGSAVVDSRGFPDHIRRRRVCHHCQHRFTTYETIVAPRARVTGIATQLRAIAGTLEAG